ncbi:MAG: metallophosphoesterase family protein [Candidatus Dadabacteria bacterium]
MKANKNTLSRREFVRSMGILAAAVPFGASALDLLPGDSFSFMLLGDMHFDNLDFHDLEYVRTKFSEGDVTQVNNYSRITRDNLPGLMKKVKEKGISANADFYLQMGDFVEGLCGSEELALRQTNGFISMIKQQELNRPFIVVKGNHDVTGIGAPETFRNVVLPWQSGEQKQEVKSANSTFVHKNARFILFDGYAGDQSLQWVKEVLANTKEKLVFFCVHQPVIPFTPRANWHLYGRPTQQKQREELLNTLGEHNAIVLCGHLHKTSIVSRKTDKGRIVQVCTGSVIESPKAAVKDHLKGVDAYGTQLLELEPNFNPATLQERKENLANEKKNIEYFEYADFMGYSSLSISNKGNVEISIYRNMDNEPWTVTDLTGLLKA